MQTTFKLDINALAACAPAMSKEEARYYLNGVHIFERDGEIVYEATNGHMLIRCVSGVEQAEPDPNDTEKTISLGVKGINIIIPSFIVNQLAKPAFVKGFGIENPTHLTAVIDETRINFEMLNGLVNFKLLDGTFPDADRVIPQKMTCKNLEFDQIGFNIEYFDQIAKSIKRYTGKSGAKLAFSSTENSGPIRIDSDGSANWFAILMPMCV